MSTYNQEYTRLIDGYNNSTTTADQDFYCSMIRELKSKPRVQRTPQEESAILSKFIGNFIVPILILFVTITFFKGNLEAFLNVKF
jgi:hypothetical protein